MESYQYLRFLELLNHLNNGVWACFFVLLGIFIALLMGDNK